MLLELIATVAAGVVAAALMMMLRFVVRGKLPGSAVPIAAGLAMLAYAVWSEQTWFDRRVEALPEGFEVVSSVETQAWFRPWTYIVPMTSRFMAADIAGMRRNEAVPDQALLEVLLAARWMPDALLPVLIDCAGKRRADIVDGAEMDDDGRLIDAKWYDLDAGDLLLEKVCRVL